MRLNSSNPEYQASQYHYAVCVINENVYPEDLEYIMNDSHVQ